MDTLTFVSTSDTLRVMSEQAVEDSGRRGSWKGWFSKGRGVIQEPSPDYVGSPELTSATNTRITKKLLQRQKENKPLDVLISDIDGTLYIHSRQGVFVGQNAETARQLNEKQIPFIVNTGRPAWDGYEDARLERFDLPRPDAVIAGTGTVIYWRDNNGELHIDDDYASRMANHRIIIKEGPSSPATAFDPQVIAKTLLPDLRRYVRAKEIVDVLVDAGPMLPNGEFGAEGLRLVAMEMSYDRLKEFIQHIREKIAGVKVDFSEISEQSTADDFTGWLHIIPTIAGKEQAARYVLGKIHDGLAQDSGHVPGQEEQKIDAHVVGDASNDLRILTMGAHPQRDPFRLHQYGLQNLPDYPRRKLEDIITILDQAKDTGAPRAQVKILEKSGPEGVHQIVNELQ